MAAPYKNKTWNARELGAYGDGTTNDSPALQEALDFMPHTDNQPSFDDQEGGTLFLPKGTYKLSTPLRVRSGCVIQGEGQGTVILYEGSGDYAIELKPFSTSTSGFAVDIVIRDLAIYTTSSHGIGVPNPHCQIGGCLFENLYFSTGKRGIHIPGNSEDYDAGYVQNCVFRNLVGRKMGMGLIFIENNSVCVAEGLNIEGAMRVGFVTNETSAAITFLGGNLTLRDCLVEGLFQPTEDPEDPLYFTGPFYKFGGGITGNVFGGVFIKNYAERPDATDLTYVFQNLYNGLLSLNADGKMSFDEVQAFIPVLELQNAGSDLSARLTLTGACKLTVGQAIVGTWPITYSHDQIAFLSVYNQAASPVKFNVYPAALFAPNTTTVTTAGIDFFSLTPTWQGTISGTCNDLHVNATETTFSGTHNLMNLLVGGTPKFTITSAGAVTAAGSITGTTGTFSGAISGTSASFSGAISAGGATFSGAITGTGASFSGTISGNGSGLTSLNASNVSAGTLADARLSSNVALKNAANAFTDAPQSISKTVTGAGINFLSLTPTWSTTTGTANDIFVNAAESSFSGTHNLMDLQLGGTPKFSVTATGKVTAAASILAGRVATGGTIASPDLAVANAFEYSLGELTFELSAPTNSRVGMSYVVYIVNAAGDWLEPVFNSAYKFGNLTAPALDNGEWMIMDVYCQASGNHIVKSINGNY